MYGQTRDGFRLVFNRDVKTQCVPGKPVVRALIGADTVVLLTQPKDRAIVHDLAVVVAPDCIAHPVDANFADVSRNQTIQIPLGVGPGHAILVHG